MIIDCHNHVFWHQHDDHALVRNMDEYGIDRTWVLTWEVPEGEYAAVYDEVCDPRPGGMSLERAVGAVRNYPHRLILGYAPDPRKRESMAKLKAAVALFGVRTYGELKLRMCFDNPDAMAMYKLCGELGLPVTFHIDEPLPLGDAKPWEGYWYMYGIDGVERALQQCPRTNFLGHAPGWWRHISGDADTRREAYPDGPVTPGGKLVRLMRQYANIYCDLSAGSGLNAIKRDRAFGRTFLIEFQDKVLYGRDCFDNGHLEYLRELELPAEAVEKITSKNALKLVPVE